MISLFSKHRAAPLNLLTLPTYAVSPPEARELAAKREAQLRWMREKGMTYLGDPLQRAEPRALRKPDSKARVVALEKHLYRAEEAVHSA